MYGLLYILFISILELAQTEHTSHGVDVVKETGRENWDPQIRTENWLKYRSTMIIMELLFIFI